MIQGQIVCFQGLLSRLNLSVRSEYRRGCKKKSSPTVYNYLVSDKMFNKSASTVISECLTVEIHTLTIMVHSILAQRKGSLGSSSTFSRWGLPGICRLTQHMFYFLVSSQWKVDRQRVADLLVKASDDITCDPRQASNCVEKDEYKTDNPKIGVPALIFTIWLIEASFWNASITSRSGCAVAEEDI